MRLWESSSVRHSRGPFLHLSQKRQSPVNQVSTISTCSGSPCNCAHLFWISTGPTKTGGLPVDFRSSRRFWYETGVHSYGPKLKVGCICITVNITSSVQNFSISASCTSEARAMDKLSFPMLTSRMNLLFSSFMRHKTDKTSSPFFPSNCC